MTNILKAKIEDLSDIKVKVEKATDVTYNTDHAKLDNLDYESSGHIGFASKQELQEGLSQKQDLGNYVTEESLSEKDYASNSDLELKADKTYVDSELELKQDKGDYITRDEANEDHIDLLNQANAYTDSLSATKVDKEEGKGLSSNDFTDDLKDNLNLNTASRHSHANKAILDNTTASFTEEYKTNVDNHIGNTLNPHSVTKEQVGLSNVDNTRDIDKPVSTAQNIAIDSALNQAKQYTDTQIENKNFVDKDTLDIKLSLKVDKEDGKGLSSNDFTDSDKSNLDQNTLSRHQHENKDILDNTNASFTEELLETINSNSTTLASHTSDLNNPHEVTKNQIGLSNVDNTSDLDKPVSKAQKQALSDNLQNAKTYTDAKIAELDFVSPSDLDLKLADKVDKEEGKGLSEVNFSVSDKSDLDQNTASRHTHTNKTILDEITAAFTSELKNEFELKYDKPLDGIPESDLSAEVINKLNAEKGLIDIVKVNGEALPIEPTDKSVDINLSKYDNHISNTSNPHNVTAAQINAEPAFTKNTAFNKNFGDTADTVCEGNDVRLSNARPASDVYDWAKQPKKPIYTKDEIGLENVDNTADIDKPVSNAQREILDELDNKITGLTDTTNSHIENKDNPHLVTASQIGAEPSFEKNTAFNKNFGTGAGTVCEGNDERLSNSRPASDVSAWAKQPTKPTYTKAEVGLGNVDNTADVNKPVSTAQAQAIDASLNKAKSYTDNALSEANFLTQSQLDPQLANKVDKEVGKGLSDNNFSNLDKTNLDANTEARHTHLNKDILDKITEAFTAELKNEFESKYTKLSTGIPESDLSAELQAKIDSIGNINTVLESILGV